MEGFVPSKVDVSSYGGIWDVGYGGNDASLSLRPMHYLVMKALSSLYICMTLRCSWMSAPKCFHKPIIKLGRPSACLFLEPTIYQNLIKITHDISTSFPLTTYQICWTCDSRHERGVNFDLICSTIFELESIH